MRKVRTVTLTVVILVVAVADITAQTPRRWSLGPVAGVAWPSVLFDTSVADSHAYAIVGAGFQLSRFPANWTSVRVGLDYIRGLQSADKRLSYIDIPIWLRVSPAGDPWFGNRVGVFAQLGVTSSISTACYLEAGPPRFIEGECDEIRQFEERLRVSPFELSVGIGGGVEIRRAEDGNESMTIEFRYLRGVLKSGSEVAPRYPAVSLLVGYRIMLGQPVSNQ